MSELAEYYDEGNSAHDALGRSARQLADRSALYLGGDIGAEKKTTEKATEFVVSQAGTALKTHAGPLAAVIHAYGLAGKSTAPDSPGGAAVLPSASVAARVRELDDEIRSASRSIARQEARLTARAEKRKNGIVGGGAMVSDDDWIVRDLAETRKSLAQYRAERAQLVPATKTTKVAEGMAGSTLGMMLGEAAAPGVKQFQRVTPENRKKVSPLVDHYRKQAHPFAACVRDNRKRFGARTEAVCAVVKDMGQGTTMWRGKGKGKVAEANMLDLAEQRMQQLDVALGEGAALRMAAGGPLGEDDVFDALAEQALIDFSMLWLGARDRGGRIAEAFGWPPATVEEAFAPAQAPIVMKQTPAARERRADAKKKAKGSSTGSDDEKHPRGTGEKGGQFIAKGSSGSDVETVQRKVGAKVDGQAGAETEAKIRAFQKKHGLTVDGKVGHQTAVALAGNYGAAKSAKVGALKGSDRAKLKAAKRKAPAKRRAGKSGAPDRARGGVKVSS